MTSANDPMDATDAPLPRQPSKPAVLLVNLGTPEAPTAKALRPYLRQFLSDPRVIEIPRAVWAPILYGVILNTRPRKSAEKYAQIWMDGGSPLKVYTEMQTRLLRAHLGEQGHAGLVVDYAMRYGHPSIPERLAEFAKQGVNRILVLPLYPQFAASSTASALDELWRVFMRQRDLPEIRVIKHYPEEAGYIAALAERVTAHWQAHGRGQKLLMSFHGVPRRTMEKGDPYYWDCQKTGRLLAEKLGLAQDAYQITFQSRFGRAEWLQPYTAQTLETLAKSGVRRVDVMCPGFVSDCLETLEEIAMEGKITFLKAGGTEFHYIPCLNDHPHWIRTLAGLALRNLGGWLNGQSPATPALPTPGRLTAGVGEPSGGATVPRAVPSLVRNPGGAPDPSPVD